MGEILEDISESITAKGIEIFISMIWLKARPIDGVDSDIWRADRHGIRICRYDFYNSFSKYGWKVEIDSGIIADKSSINLDHFEPVHWYMCEEK